MATTVDDNVISAPPTPAAPPTVVVNGNSTITVTIPPIPAGMLGANIFVDGVQVNGTVVASTSYTSTMTFATGAHRVTYCWVA